LEPEAAAAIQSAGRVRDASTVPESAVATSAGAAPDLIFNTASVPMVDSIASKRAFRTLVESWIAMGFPYATWRYSM
jgi:hypothetical protein